MTSSGSAQNVAQLLEQLKLTAEPTLPDELSYLFSSFTLDKPSDTKSKAYVILSAFCQGVRASGPQPRRNEQHPATERLAKVFEAPIRARLEETEEKAQLEGLSFFTALFQVDWECASSAFQKDGIYELVADCVELAHTQNLAEAVAQLLGQACGHKACRALITPPVLQWLEKESRRSSSSVRAAAAVTLIKYSKGVLTDQPEASGSSDKQSERQADAQLAYVLIEEVIKGTSSPSIACAVEGLAYLSVNPDIKEALSQDSVFLKCLFERAPRRANRAAKPPEGVHPQDTALLFGILTVASNLCAHRPQLTEEQAQLEKLRRMTQSGQKPSQSTDNTPADTEEIVNRRVHRLVSAGVLDVLAFSLTSESSSGVRSTVAKTMLNVIQDRENRGRVLQSGGAKVLTTIIKQDLPVAKDAKQNGDNPSLREAIQALAKLAITSSPVQVFGPNVGAIYDAVRPFSYLLLHQSSSLLQRFEAMMALTNLASHSTEVADRISKSDGLLDRVELLMLEDHTLVRRASVELVCNLIAGSGDVFNLYGGGEKSPKAKSKLHIILALSDVEDMPTRLAAAGSLAILTSAPSAAQQLIELQQENDNVIPMLCESLDLTVLEEHKGDQKAPYLGLVHRGVVSIRNIFTTIGDIETKKAVLSQMKEIGMFHVLVKIAKNEVEGLPKDVSLLALEAVKHLLS